MSVPSATAAASTRPRKDSRTVVINPKGRVMTPKQSGVDGLEEFQRKRRMSTKSTTSKSCCIVCILALIVFIISIAMETQCVSDMDLRDNRPG